MLFKDYFLQLTNSIPFTYDVILPEVNGLVIQHEHKLLFEKYGDLENSTLTLEKLNSIVSRMKELFEQKICNKTIYGIDKQAESFVIPDYYETDCDNNEYQKSVNYYSYTKTTHVVTLSDFEIEFRPHSSSNEFKIAFRFFIHFKHLKGNNGINLTINNMNDLDLDINNVIDNILSSPKFNPKYIEARLHKLYDERFNEIDTEIRNIEQEIENKQNIIDSIKKFKCQKILKGIGIVDNTNNEIKK